MTETSNADPAATSVGIPQTGAIDSQAKWWGQSLTLWGTMITALSTVLPTLAPLFGFEISGETVRQLGGRPRRRSRPWLVWRARLWQSTVVRARLPRSCGGQSACASSPVQTPRRMG